MSANPAIYLDDYADEVMPSALSESTLEGWALWLSEGGEPVEEGEEGGCWTFDPPKDGALFWGESLTFEEDIDVIRSEDGERLTYSRPVPAGIDFAALRFAPEMGWSPDDILDPTELEDALHEALDRGEEGCMAVARRQFHRFRYSASPPRLIVIATSDEALPGQFEGEAE